MTTLDKNPPKPHPELEAWILCADLLAEKLRKLQANGQLPPSDGSLAYYTRLREEARRRGRSL